MPKLSAEAFFNLVQQSGLIEPRKLQPLVEQVQQAGVDMNDAAAAAAWLVDHGALTQWQTNKLLQGKHKGFTLGKYRLMELLGKGGMSSVYLAEHQLMRRRCAIKVLPIKRVNDSSYLERFHREARAVASLDHPNIVRAYDIDHEMDGDREIHFLVMEHVNGQSIQDIVKDHGVLTLEQTAEYFRQSALGLDNAHNNGLVHRDVKPGNLLVDQSGVVKVLDLGLARFNEQHDESGAPLTVAHDEKVLGTADYLAPEQALDSHEVDHRADIYALGCSMYYALTGHPPFKDGTLTQRLMWHQVKEPPEISESRPDVDATEAGRALVAIIKKLMRKPADDRYQTMAEAADALMSWLQQHAGSEWQAAHGSDDSGSSKPGSDVAVAAPVAAPMAAAPVAEAAPPVAAPVAPDVNVAPVAPAEPVPAAAPVVAPAAAPVAPATAPPGDAGFNAFLSQLDGNAPAPAAPPEPVAPAAAVPVEPAAVPVEPAAAPVAEAAAPLVSPFAPETPAADEIPAAPAAEAAIATPIDTAAEDTIPEVSPVAADAGAIPVAAPIAEAVPVTESAPIAEAAPVAEALDTGSDSGAVDGDPPVAQPLEGFDEGLLPDPDASADEFPSLLGGSPTDPAQQLPGGQTTAAELAPTQTFIPDNSGSGSDATLITPSEDSSIPPGASPIIAPPEQPAAAVAEAVPGSPIGPVADVAPAAPQFPGPSDAAPAFPAPAAPTFPEPGAPAAPTFPGAPAADAPAFPGAPAAPAFPGAPVADAPAFPGAPVVGDAPQSAFPGAPAGAPVAAPATPAASTPARAKKPLPVGLIAGVAVAVIAIGAGAWFFLGGDDDTQTGEGPGTAQQGTGTGEGEGTSGGDDPDGSATVAVGGSGVQHPDRDYSLTVGPDGDYTSLKACLDDLKKNSRAYERKALRQKITVKVVSGDSSYGPIVIDSGHPTGIYLKNEGVSKPTVKASGSGPAVKITDAEFFGMEGFHIDAAGKATGIELSGDLARTRLANLRVTGYSGSGILGRAAAGDPTPADALKIENIVLEASGSNATGIRLEDKDEVSSARTTVRGCRLTGPHQYGIVVDGGCSQIELRENLVDQAEIGVYLTGGSLSWRNFLIGNMTFYKCSKAGIAFDNMPSPGGGFAGTSMSFIRNLFAECGGPELLVEEGFSTDKDDEAFDKLLSATGKSVEQNWTDRQEHAVISSGQREIVAREPAEPDTRRPRSFNFISTDRGDPGFLAPRRGQTYSNLGGSNQGAKPYAGAVAPQN